MAPNNSPKNKKKYIPHLAEFYFSPDEDWPVAQAQTLFSKTNCVYDRIEFGNCIDGMQSLEPESVDLIIADPPFGIDFSGKESIYNRDPDNVIEDYEEVIEDYDSFTLEWISELPRIMKNHASAYIFSGYTNLPAVLNAINKVGLELINHIIWKYQFGVFTTRKFVTSHYHVLFIAKDINNYYFNRIEHYNEDVWIINRKYMKGQKKNGTKLPVEVVEKCINFSSKPGDLVFDPFMGNGTTAVAAKLNFRHYLGFEFNKKLESVITHNLTSVKIGGHYKKSYSARLPTPEQLSKLDGYTRAYNEFKKTKNTAHR